MESRPSVALPAMGFGMNIVIRPHVPHNVLYKMIDEAQTYNDICKIEEESMRRGEEEPGNEARL